MSAVEGSFVPLIVPEYTLCKLRAFVYGANEEVQVRFFILITLALCACQKTANPPEKAVSNAPSASFAETKEPGPASVATLAPAPDAMDYHPFGLKLGSVAVLNEIVSKQLGSQRVTPSEGNRLVAVTLQGNVPGAMSLKIATRDFRAKFDQTERSAAGVEYNGIWIVSGRLDGNQSIAASVSFKAEKAQKNPFP